MKKTVLTSIACLVIIAGCEQNHHVSVYTAVADLPFADPVLRQCVLDQASRDGWQNAG
jgi:uncharacterized lipoprotein YajG